MSCVAHVCDKILVCICNEGAFTTPAKERYSKKADEYPDDEVKVSAAAEMHENCPNAQIFSSRAWWAMWSAMKLAMK
jgi:hypothetical protein